MLQLKAVFELDPEHAAAIGRILRSNLSAQSLRAHDLDLLIDAKIPELLQARCEQRDPEAECEGIDRTHVMQR